jgi:CubicO group peptidase (beta-lactamase class C family)
MKSVLALLLAVLVSPPLIAAAPPGPLAPLFANDQGEPRAAMLIVGNRVVAKQYAPGYDDRTRFISWSMAKTVTAVLVGELVADGRLSLDAPAPVAEWRQADDPRRTITLRQLLHMSSGLQHTEVGKPIQASDTNQVLFVGGTGAMAARAIGKPLEAAPGTRYEYSSMTSVILAEIVTRTLTQSRDPLTRARAYRGYAEARLFRPAGIASAVLEFDGAGTQVGGSIIHMTLPDWARFGQLLLDGKGVDARQVIAPDWLAFMREPAPTDSGYGGHVWLNRPRPAGSPPALFPGSGPASLFAAVGHLGQYVIVSPEQRLVLVRLGKTQDDNLDPVRRALGQVVSAVPAARQAIASGGR